MTLGRDCGRSHAAAGSLVLLALLLPSPAFAHASERMIILTLPTGRYIPAPPPSSPSPPSSAPSPPASPPSARTASPPSPTRRTTPAAGSPSPPSPPSSPPAFSARTTRSPTSSPSTVWTLLWVGLALASMLAGDLWRPIDPWTAPVTLTRRLLGRTGSIGLARLGHWPAVAGLLAIAWFEIVSLAPDDPPTLARAALLYWLAVFALATLEGPAFIRRGEALTLFFHFVSKIAPVWWTPAGRRTELHAGPPGAQILATPPLSPSAAAFVTLILATVTFDGLHLTFWWLARLGINPLEFPGRSAVTGANSLGLLAAWAPPPRPSSPPSP